jgi:hypothetical protein
MELELTAINGKLQRPHFHIRVVVDENSLQFVIASAKLLVPSKKMTLDGYDLAQGLQYGDPAASLKPLLDWIGPARWGIAGK